MAVLVTGATGFVGTHLLRAFSGKSVPAFGLARQGSPQSGLWRTLHSWTPDEVARALSGIDVVVHAASVVHRPGAGHEEYERFNREGTGILVDACRKEGVRTLVFVSSIKVYGEDPRGVIDEETPLDPEGSYAGSKLDAERLVEAASPSLRTVILRLCPVYGRGDKGNVRAMIRAIQGRRFVVPGAGATRKSLVHVSTVCQVVLAASERQVSGVFVVADREAPSIRELADTIAGVLGRRRPLAVPAPVLLATASAFERVLGRRSPITRDLVRKTMIPTVCSPARAEQAFGVDCHVDLRSAIEDEVAWLREAKLLR